MDDQNSSWNYRTEDVAPDRNEFTDNQSLSPTESEPVTWSGSEFIANHKSGFWYLTLVGFLSIVCALVYLVSRDLISVIFIAIMGVLFAVIAGRKPRQFNYSIDSYGIHVGQKFYPYSDFLSFSMQKDGAIGYINMLPLHRLRNELSIYYPPEDEERIFNALASQLPNQQRKETYIDRLVKFIRF